MTRIADALELLTAQHDQLDALLADLGAAVDPSVRPRLVDELATLLTGHLAIEQEVLYPALARQISAGVLTEVLDEHAEIKRVLATLLWLEPDDAQFGPTLATLRALLSGHAAWQDDQLMAPAAQSMTDAVLASLRKHMHHWFDAPPLAAAA